LLCPAPAFGRTARDLVVHRGQARQEPQSMPRLTHALRPAEQTCCSSGRLAVLLRSWDAVADAEGCRAAHHLPYHAKRKAMVMMQSDEVQGPGSATGPLESRPDLAVPAA